MKKTLCMVLALVMCLPLCACGSDKEEFDPRSAFRRTVESAVTAYCIVRYADVKVVDLTTLTIDVTGDKYTGKGKFTIRDDYGDTYTGKVTAVYKFDEESKTFTKISLDIERPTKQ